MEAASKLQSLAAVVGPFAAGYAGVHCVVEHCAVHYEVRYVGVHYVVHRVVLEGRHFL